MCLWKESHKSFAAMIRKKNKILTAFPICTRNNVLMCAYSLCVYFLKNSALTLFKKEELSIRVLLLNMK